MGKIGLVLEGGAMRGMFTSGVLDVFMENGIKVDGAIGVSAGATFGCNYKSGQIGRAIRYNKRFCKDWRYCSLRSLIKTGDMYGAEFCYEVLPNQLDILDAAAYKANPMPFYCVTSDCQTGKPIYKELKTCDKNDLVWMRASASMPLVSKVVEIDGYKMLDGGMTDSIPLKYFESIGYEKNIVILTQPRDYKKSKNKMMFLVKMALKKYPEIVKAMKNRHIVYNKQKQYALEEERKGNALIICPEKSLGISRTEKKPDELQRVYELGRLTAQNRLEEIKKFIQA